MNSGGCRIWASRASMEFSSTNLLVPGSRVRGTRHDEVVLRDVSTGAGVLDLVEWTDAVKSTGYQGWWSCELFCRWQQQQNGFRVAAELRALITRLIESPRVAQAGAEARPR
ncbi:sugar phosphate isomerase/epimerase [Burkholderia gladioli]|uniref:sugar phosphate isomerase/epimerase n=1 Tax=Burkholderia gladioli TaxID=28095 RepID=UPI001FC85338|nr:sugar phosphate isomerase/epimerase [Burkholderia gladioli]